MCFLVQRWCLWGLLWSMGCSSGHGLWVLSLLQFKVTWGCNTESFQSGTSVAFKHVSRRAGTESAWIVHGLKTCSGKMACWSPKSRLGCTEVEPMWEDPSDAPLFQTTAFPEYDLRNLGSSQRWALGALSLSHQLCEWGQVSDLDGVS